MIISVKRAAALATTLSFLVTHTVFAGAVIPPSPSAELSTLVPEKISLPAELGTIQKQVFAGRDKPFLIYIQDAHAVMDAQQNIQKLIAYLQEKYGIDLVTLEAGEGPLDPTLLRAFPDAFLKTKVTEDYLKRGELNGAESAAILNPKQARYFGIEDWKLYEENYLAYLRAVEKQPEILKRLSAEKKRLDAERKNVFSAGLNEFHEKVEAFEDDRLPLADLLEFLSRNVPDPVKYPHLSSLTKSIHKEASDASVRRMAESFKKKYAARLEKQALMKFNERHQAFLAGGMDAGTFLKSLVETGKGLGLTPKLSSAMQERLGEVEMLSAIKGTRLFDELHSFLKDTRERFLTTDAQRTLSVKFEEIRFLKDLAFLQLTRDQWTDRANPAALRLLGPSLIAPAEAFYRTAIKRDEAFRRNLASLMKKEKSKAAILLAGGFHSEGFEETSRKAGYSYAIVTPKINSLQGHELYADVMQGKVSYKNYLQTTFYDAFMRHATLELVGGMNEPDFRRNMKVWRDEVIRALSKEGRIAEAGSYTV